jgi:hypothetical protein
MVWQISDAVDKVACAPDDGWRCHPKHVEQFPDVTKLCKAASCWIYWNIFTMRRSINVKHQNSIHPVWNPLTIPIHMNISIMMRTAIMSTLMAH